ncbi:hypothetical protein FRB94_007623 [Tulasnella sp. JGI-2019a]|nr:hypothetical protein FRB93_007340 [Tulasnella sp. JGI-2019a]KAG8997530.1 hypothetical protein FRB94_007623 [Tulasnella sp. JGI-2019a]
MGSYDDNHDTKEFGLSDAQHLKISNINPDMSIVEYMNPRAFGHYDVDESDQGHLDKAWGGDDRLRLSFLSSLLHLYSE